MHDFNEEFHRTIINDRSREATNFFRMQHLAALQRQQKKSAKHTYQSGLLAAISFKSLRRSMCMALQTLRMRKVSNALR